MLLIDDNEAERQPALLEQCLRADNQVDVACFDAFGQLAPFLRKGGVLKALINKCMASFGECTSRSEFYLRNKFVLARRPCTLPCSLVLRPNATLGLRTHIPWASGSW